MPRFQFTVRRMMVAVAIVGVMFGAWRVIVGRRERFRQIAAEHGRGFEGMVGKIVSVSPRRIVWAPTARESWHMDMKRKYEIAARYPWLYVPPDPPLPE